MTAFLPFQLGVGLAATLYLVTINLLTLWTFKTDALRAEAGSRRLPERLLVLLAIIGGSLVAQVAAGWRDAGPHSTGFRGNLKILVAAQAGVILLFGLPHGPQMAEAVGRPLMHLSSLLVGGVPLVG